MSRLQEKALQLGISLPSDAEELFESLRDAWKELPASEKEKAQLFARAVSATSGFTYQAFMDFYWCLWRREVPPFVKEWVEAFMSKNWTILYCFRGSTKSTTLIITFTLFWLMYYPHTSALIIQANDTSANRSTALISDIIEHYEGWKACAPHLVPDKDKGWGANGYFIKDTRVDYQEWLVMCQRDHLRDPSFVGMGITSGEIVGMHPTLLLFDDIHDRKNSAYPGDRQAVVDSVRANVLPTITRANDGTGNKPFIGVACTFWDEQDAYHVLLNTGLFKYIETPIMRFDDNGDHEFEGKKVFLTWEDGFPMEMIKYLRDMNSSKEFARMYLCDLTSKGVSQYPSWMSYPAKEINWNWPMVCGADPVQSYKATRGVEGDRSHFALAYGLRSSTGAVVLGGGVLTKCTPFEAEQYIARAQNAYSGYQTTVIETYGGGSVFISFLQRNPNLRILPSDELSKMRGKKEIRQYEILEPLLRTGVLQISDENTPFLMSFRSYLDKYPNLSEHSPEWDVADSVYYMVLGFPDIQARAFPDQEEARFRKYNPWAAIV